MPATPGRFIRKFLPAVLAATLSAACGTGAHHPREVERALARLDRTIAEKNDFEVGKEQHLARIKAKITSGCTDERLYGIYDDLYDEYYQYNLDSAICYARAKLEVAGRTGNPELTNDAVLDMADRYVLSGMYVEAQAFVSKVDTLQLSYGQLPRYYHIYHALYDGMAISSGDPQLRAEYIRLKNRYRKKLYEKLGADDIARLYVRADMLCDEGDAEEGDAEEGDAEEGDAEEALRMLLDRYEDSETTVHERAVLAYLIATAYRQTGRDDEAAVYYAESAVHDLKTPVHEYRSLYELASLLYESGDIERAYNYITCSVNDAMTANARINIHSINRLLPIISRSYDRQMTRKRRQLNRMLWGLSLLSLLFIAAAAVAYRDKRRASAAESQTREMNDELSRVNARLQKYIGLLQESNNIKESYLGRYLDLCSDYIGHLDAYRSQLGKIARTGGMAEIQKALRSTAFIDSELEDFYAKFDATFLHLFPDFVTQFNGLLQPEKQVSIDPHSGLLTTELRIFALIRLGIGDSAKIAEFLRRSVSTVYNYRVKMRNAALVGREDFEKQVLHIGRLS